MRAFTTAIACATVEPTVAFPFICLPALDLQFHFVSDGFFFFLAVSCFHFETLGVPCCCRSVENMFLLSHAGTE